MKNDDPTIPVIYVTKYVLAHGIEKFENVRHCLSSVPGGTLVQAKVRGYDNFFHVEGKEWHRTEEAAKVRARHMLNKKIASVEKQLARLRTLVTSI